MRAETYNLTIIRGFKAALTPPGDAHIYMSLQSSMPEKIQAIKQC
jgi:hypothetical protein